MGETIAVRIGVLGGTFDPVHYGHLRLAEEAREAMMLERVILIPASVSPFKTVAHHASPAHRLQMLRLAVQDNPYFEVSDIEVRRGGVSYTVDTIATLRQHDSDAAWYLIMGADALGDFPNWHQPEKIAQACTLLVGMRPDYDLQATLKTLPESIRACVQPIPTAPLNISATELRQRIRAGRSIRYLTPTHVIEYIHQHRLYLEP
ncbi:MAG: putative nicotinate-nucleotide adenylyltransferase [Fimbriimonadales bacterium]|nr:MAG: putative nicotinate-nucleotide adenylyltransferase [Fimbriimonadales bacterium]